MDPLSRLTMKKMTLHGMGGTGMVEVGIGLGKMGWDGVEYVRMGWDGIIISGSFMIPLIL